MLSKSTQNYLHEALKHISGDNGQNSGYLWQAGGCA